MSKISSSQGVTGAAHAMRVLIERMLLTHFMFVTLETFQEFRLPLNAVAP